MEQPITEIIKKRRSVRDFQNKPVSPEIMQQLKEYIHDLTIPFGANVRMEIVQTNSGEKKQKLGTYGVISGATTFFVTAFKPGNFAEEALGYAFEELVLYCTRLGLGTCWLGGTFSGKNFTNAMKLQPDEKLTIVSPVGYPADRNSFLGNVFATMARSSTRKPFETLFFRNRELIPLTEAEAGRYQIPLEMVRWAPSASNKQPWRAIVEGETVHFYLVSNASRFGKTDTGIALCHFELTCKEQGITGQFSEEPEAKAVPVKGLDYIMSWKG